MNERYQELVRLAVEDAAKYSKRRFDITVEENETFALCLTELIVQECILTIQMGVTRDGTKTEKFIRSMKHIKDIKEHFGVKE